MTFDVIHYTIKIMCIYNDSIHTMFCKDQSLDKKGI